MDLYEQLARLGEMMGDGLHHEEPWIAKEYNHISRLLFPDIHRDLRVQKNKATDEKMKELFTRRKCYTCQGELKQLRSGSLTCLCSVCGAKFKAKYTKI